MIKRTPEQMAADRERVREMARILTAHLDVAGIPYERIIREYDAAVYVPAIEDNQVMVAMVGMKRGAHAAVPPGSARRAVSEHGRHERSRAADQGVVQAGGRTEGAEETETAVMS